MFVRFQQTFFLMFSSPTRSPLFSSLCIYLSLSPFSCESEVYVWEGRGRKKSSQAFGRSPKKREKNCATIADKTNTFVASKRNVHKARFGRNVKIFVKMPTPYNRPQSQSQSKSRPPTSWDERERERGEEAVIYLLVSATTTMAMANEYGWLNDAGNSTKIWRLTTNNNNNNNSRPNARDR